MAKTMEDGGQPCTNKDAADCLAQGHPKSGSVAQTWGMKDQDGGASAYKPKGLGGDPYEK